MGVDGIITDYPDDMVTGGISLNSVVSGLVEGSVPDVDGISDSDFENGEY